MEINKP